MQLNKMTKDKEPATVIETPSRYVAAPKLLEMLFDDDCRPSLRWLREKQAARKIPFVKIGRLVFFDPPAVKAALDALASRRMFRGAG
jgi:hypothetical protein